MRACIDKSFLGTPKSLILNEDETFQWGEEKDCDVCVFCGQNPNSIPLEDLAKIINVSLDGLSIAGDAQSRAFSSLGVDLSSVPWFLAIGRDQFKSRISTISKLISSIIRDPDLSKYISIYTQGRKFLFSLSRPSIDPVMLNKISLERDLNLSVLASIKSLTPEEDGLAPRIVYDQSATATGRLTVKKGPSILTLPKEYRSVIRSSCGGKIFEVDFVSLEPRVALNIMGVNPPRDIYEDIRSRTQMSGLTRQIIKQAVISSLYGSSPALLAESLGGQWEALNLIKEVKKYFRVSDMTSRLRSEMSIHKNRLHNYYGRPLVHICSSDSDAKLISYYLQSTAVDVALLGFSSLYDKIKSLGVRPIYVIHDALLVDVPKEAETDFFRMCNAGIDLDIGHFELSCNKILGD